MLYTNIRTSIVYNGQKELPLPKGDTPGYGNALFLLTPNQEASIEEIRRGYMRWYLDGYRHYTTDTYFREKIGKKQIMVNMNGILQREWGNIDFGHTLRLVVPRNRAAMLSRKPNVMVDLGDWIHFYFQYSLKISIPVIVKNFVQFLSNKMRIDAINEYSNKLIYIPLDSWSKELKAGLGFTKEMLNNPISILLFASYKYPEVLATLPPVKILLASAKHQQFIQLDLAEMNRKNFPMLKSKLIKLIGVNWDEPSEKILDLNFTPEEEDANSPLNNEEDTTSYSDPRGIVPTVRPDAEGTDIDKATANIIRDNRTRLINEMKRDLLGTSPTIHSDINKKSVNLKEQASPSPEITDEKVASLQKIIEKDLAKPEDLTTSDEVYDEEDIEEQKKDLTPIHLDDEQMDSDVEEAVDDELEKIRRSDNPESILHLNEEQKEEVRDAVAHKVRQSYMPQHTDESMARIKELMTRQDKVIKRRPTAQQVKSKVIETSDFSRAIKTTNPYIKQSKYVNFDHDYTTKKLQQDIDDAVMQLNKASSPIFVIGKEEKDTSTQLDLKKTVTYHLEDEWGNKHTVTLDIPIIVEDKYIYKNGQKLLLGHQQIMMPIVKSNATDVQIVTWYNKLILRREGSNDTRTSALKKYMAKNAQKFGLILGNAASKNRTNHHPSTLDIDMIAKQYMSFHIGNTYFYLDRNELFKRLKARMPNAKVTESKDQIPVGFNVPKREVIYVTPNTSLTDIILNLLEEGQRDSVVRSIKRREQKLLRTNVKIMNQMVPLVLLLCFYEPFETVMKKAEIEYFRVSKEEDLDGIDMSHYDYIELESEYVVWPRNPIWNTMLMNGFANVDLTDYSYEDLNDKETFSNLMSNYWTSVNIANSLMQYYDFMLDPATIEILEDYGYPTDLVSLMLLGNRMLVSNDYTAISNAKAFRVRSNEIIAETVYSAITAAYYNYRKTQHKMGKNKKPDRLNVKQSAVMDEITHSSLTNEASVLNPILELEKARSITPRGPRGVGKERAMTEEKRAYDPSMIGIMAMTTSPDAKVGVNRQLTLEPNITSTRGYVQETPMDQLDDLNMANLLSPSELLSPPGALHDDGPRTSMGYKQTQYMLPIAGSAPVFFGNKVEAAVPYHLSREFVVTAKQDGEVVEINDGWIIVQYKDGTYDSIDTNPKMRKNSSSGFYIKTHLTSHLTEVGQKFKKNEVLAQDNRAFTKNEDDLSASLNIGVPIKVAIIPNYDIYEDAAPITEKLSEKFTTYMSMQESAGIPAQSYVESIVEVGQRVEVGDPLIVYDPAHSDEETNAFLNEIRGKLGDSLADVVDLGSLPQVRTDYAGTVAAIEIYTSVPVEELSPSLQKIYNHLTTHARNTQNILTKYQNEGDMKYYKCNQILNSAPEVVKPDYQNRVKGVMIGEDGRGVAIFFYIEFKDIAKTGDKGSAFTALKFTTSHVIPKGKEPYSEYRPNEEISSLIAPSSIIARKTPSIIETMFANKCIIEMKRHALEIFFEDKDPRTQHDD